MPGLAARPAGLAVRATWGAALLLAPATVVRHSGAPPGRALPLATRVLGARHLTQAILQYRFRSPAAACVSFGVDLVHVLSMALLAAARGTYARPALASAAVSSLLMVADGSCASALSRARVGGLDDGC